MSGVNLFISFILIIIYTAPLLLRRRLQLVASFAATAAVQAFKDLNAR